MKAWTKTLLAAALAPAVLAIGLVAGCGGDDETSTDTVAATVTTTAPAPATGTGGEATAPTPPPTTTQPPTGGTNTVPNLIGSTVAEAQKALNELSLSGRAENKSGGSRTDIKIDWEVCETHPKADAKLPIGSPITLLAAAPDAC